MGLESATHPIQVSQHHEENPPTGKPPKSNPRSCSSSIFLPQSEENSYRGSQYIPVFRSGCFADIGPKQYMEDEYICIDDLRPLIDIPIDAAFYAVFDGHGGNGAALFTKNNILGYILADSEFLCKTKKAIRKAFEKADDVLADSKTVDQSSGTTALLALVLGTKMLVANAGDSRAVLGRRGRAIELSKDHKPCCASERTRIERLGGEIHDGYLNGQIGVARALGDWEIKGSKGSKSPLIAVPDLEEVNLTEEDEFLILGCDGVWDVMSSQCAVTMARKELMVHNDPNSCSRALAKEALQRNACDNVTIVVVCFSALPPPKIALPPSNKRRSISAEGLDRLKGFLQVD